MSRFFSREDNDLGSNLGKGWMSLEGKFAVWAFLGLVVGIDPIFNNNNKLLIVIE